jgi:hypothetical protein
MMAVYLALKHFVQQKRLAGIQMIQLQTDNTTVMYDLNKKRGAPTLLHPLKLIMQFLENRQIHLHASYIPGVENTIADRLSRLARSGDYQIQQKVFEAGIQQLHTSVDVDLFSTRRNRKVQAFVSIEQDDEAIGRDAFSMTWRTFSPLIHPPIPLLLRCLRKVKEERVRGVVIAPAWSGQPWSLLLRNITIRKVNVGESSDILQAGPRMRRNGTKLPPGTLEMCLVNGEMRTDGECGTV